MTLCDPTPKRLHPALRYILLISGGVAVALAIVGMFLPVLPTVPFLLLALTCFARSSPRVYDWLLEHTHLGPLVRPYLQGGGLPRAARVKAIALLWGSIGATVLFLLEAPWLKAMLLAIALGVTLYLLRLPALKAEGPGGPSE